MKIAIFFTLFILSTSIFAADKFSLSYIKDACKENTNAICQGINKTQDNMYLLMKDNIGENLLTPVSMGLNFYKNRSISFSPNLFDNDIRNTFVLKEEGISYFIAIPF